MNENKKPRRLMSFKAFIKAKEKPSGPRSTKSIRAKQRRHNDNPAVGSSVSTVASLEGQQPEAVQGSEDNVPMWLQTMATIP